MPSEIETPGPEALHGVLEGVFYALTALDLGKTVEAKTILSNILVGEWNESASIEEPFEAEEAYEVVRKDPG